MDSVQILDHYRVSVLHSAEITRLLARLLRQGPQTEDELAVGLGRPGADLRRELAQLFRAALIQRTEPDRWRTSHLAEEILVRLEVYELAETDVIKSFGLGREDLVFLQACTSSRLGEREAKSRLALLRSLQHLADLPDSSGRVGTSESTPILLYAIMWATDPEAYQYDRSSFSSFAKLRLHGTTHKGEAPSKQVADKWWSGLNAYRESNNVLLHFSGHGVSPSDEGTLRLTLSRALGAAVLGTPDIGLQTCSRHWRDEDFSSIWRELLKNRSYAQSTQEFLHRWTSIATTNYDSLLETLGERLRASVTSNVREPALEVRPPAEKTLAASSLAEAEIAVVMVRKLSDFLRSGSSSIWPEPVRKSLANAVGELNGLLNPPKPAGRRPRAQRTK